MDEKYQGIAKCTVTHITPFLENGDLLLCSGEGLCSDLIEYATDSMFSHVAILLKMPITNQWLVMESIDRTGVRCVTLDQGYINNYAHSGKPYPGQLYFARHAMVKEKNALITNLYRQAFYLLGAPYNEHDILKIAERIALKKIGIDSAGNLKGGAGGYICSEFLYACFQAMKIDLQVDIMGFIAPEDIAADPNVTPLFQLQAMEQPLSTLGA